MMPQPRCHRRQSASVLLLVLIVVALLTLAGLAFFDRMFAEYQGAATHGRQIQARALAESGVEYLKAFISQSPDAILDAGGIYQNPANMQAVLVIDNDQAAFRGRFTVLAPGMRTDGYLADVRYGLQDESARLNLNTLLLLDNFQENGGRLALMGLPGMTESIADAILDWIDPDDEPRMLGAEANYYSHLNPGYEPKNGPLETVEQLLLVRDVTPELLFGVDMNRNGLLEDLEAQRATELGLNDVDGAMFRGWASYLTLYSAERNVRPDGQPKIDVNISDLEELRNQLSDEFTEEQANFIIAYRQGGAYDGADAGQSASAININYEEQGRVKLKSVLDLIGVKTRIVPPGENSQRVVVSPAFPDQRGSLRQDLPLLQDNLTVITDQAIPGRININQAPRALLEGLPEMARGVAGRIISQRYLEARSDRPDRDYATWILTDGIVDLPTMKKLFPLLTGGGNVYRAQIVGYFDQEGPASRIEVVLDATGTSPTLVHWRDLDDLGPGYPPETLGVELDTVGVP